MKAPWILTISPGTAVNLSMALAIWVAEPYAAAEPYRVTVSLTDGEEYTLYESRSKKSCEAFIKRLVERQ